MQPRVTVVIPTLNEAPHVGRAVRSALGQHGEVACLVVDGGSEDATVDVARREGAQILTAPRGRAAQMNAGARATDADMLLFLHADTVLRPDALDHVRRALTAGAEAGIFRLQFDRPTPLLTFYSWCTQLPWIRLAFGDRALFVRRNVFEALGGFPDWPLFEDLELAYRLWRRGRFRFRFLDVPVTTAARRFETEGALRQQLRNAYLWQHYLRGTDPQRLAHLYPYGHGYRP